MIAVEFDAWSGHRMVSPAGKTDEEAMRVLEAACLLEGYVTVPGAESEYEGSVVDIMTTETVGRYYQTDGDDDDWQPLEGDDAFHH